MTISAEKRTARHRITPQRCSLRSFAARSDPPDRSIDRWIDPSNLAVRHFSNCRFHFLAETYVRRAFSDQSISRSGRLVTDASRYSVRLGIPLLTNVACCRTIFPKPSKLAKTVSLVTSLTVLYLYT